MRIARTMTDEKKEIADSLDTIRSHTEELIRGACLLLKASHASRASHTDLATAWGTVASAKATLYLAEVIRAQGSGQPKELQPLDADSQKGKCAFCEAEFPKSALNYSSGDPACAPCQKAFDLPPS